MDSPFTSALFNSLDRQRHYTFVFHDGSERYGVFHQYLPDGTLLVASAGRTLTINPQAIAMVIHL